MSTSSTFQISLRRLIAPLAVLGLLVVTGWTRPAAATSVIGTVSVGNGPVAIAIAPSGPNAGSAYTLNPKAGTVSVVGTDGTVSATITVPVSSYVTYSRPTDIAFASAGPEAGFAYISSHKTDGVTVLNTSNVIVDHLPLSSGDMGSIAVAPTGPKVGYIYVTNPNSDSVTVYGTDHKVAATIPVGTGPLGIAVSPTGPNAGYAYVTNTNDDTVSVIDTSLKVVATINVGLLPTGIAVAAGGPNAGSVYVTNTADDPGSVSVIGTGNTVTAKIAVGQNPVALDIVPTGLSAGTVYVANNLDGTVSEIGSNHVVRSTTKVGALPTSVAVATTGPNAGYAYVANWKDSTVSIVGTPANTAPGAPTTFTATAGSKKANLAWQAPISDGGSAVTAYAVRYSSNAGSSWKSATSCSGTKLNCTVSGLKNGTTYQFEVTATNSIGTSTAATASVTPCTVPDAPTSLHTTHLSTGKAKLAWTAGSDGGATTTFDVFVGTKAGKESTQAVNLSPISTTSYKVTGLTSGKKYYFVVKARNVAGTSAKSNETWGIVP